ncbi:MAG: EF-hand domain-containing protein, partial [Sneathiella sp.]
CRLFAAKINDELPLERGDILFTGVSEDALFMPVDTYSIWRIPMKKILTVAVALSGLALASAQAETPKFEAVDTDKNGSVSMKELVAAMPTVTKEQFASVDKDGNGQLSPKEYTKATSSK